jgi:hypothetical protein
VGAWSRYDVERDEGAGVVAEGVCTGAMASSCLSLRLRVFLSLRFSERWPLSRFDVNRRQYRGGVIFTVCVGVLLHEHD